MGTDSQQTRVSGVRSATALGLAGIALALGACGGDDGEQQAESSAVESSNVLILPDGGPARPVGEGISPSTKPLPPSPGTAAGDGGAAACENADLEPSAGRLDDIEAAVACLVNAERAKRRLAPLSSNRKLAAASTAHSRDMVKRGYFSHTSPSGTDVQDRLRRARYIPRRGRHLVGENLAVGAGAPGTPRAILAAWMQSPAHRANVLERRFREIGIGTAPGTPTGNDAGVTLTGTFGVLSSGKSSRESRRGKSRRGKSGRGKRGR